MIVESLFQVSNGIGAYGVLKFSVEFVQGHKLIGLHCTDEEAKKEFAHIDTNHGGCIILYIHTYITIILTTMKWNILESAKISYLMSSVSTWPRREHLPSKQSVIPSGHTVQSIIYMYFMILQ